MDWAVTSGITTATFHIATPYPGTQLYTEMAAQNRLTTSNWDLYDTRHVVYRPIGITPQALKAGYDWAYREFYRWGNIVTAARAHQSSKHSLKHLAYSAGWKKFEPAWDFVIRLKRLSQMRPMLEAVLSPVAGRTPGLEREPPRGAIIGSRIGLTEAHMRHLLLAGVMAPDLDGHLGGAGSRRRRSPRAPINLTFVEAPLDDAVSFIARAAGIDDRVRRDGH